MSRVSNRRPKVALVTNIPAPYRVPMWNQLASDDRIDLIVIFCADKEPNREWDMDAFKFKSLVLKEAYTVKNGRYIHDNRDVIAKLTAINPDVVITTGFNPTFMYAFLYSWWNGRKHICMTDGTIASESKLSILHKCIRAFVFKRSVAFIGASEESLELYRSWNVPADRIFKSPLCIDNKRFRQVADHTKGTDIIFCGRFTEEKQPLFVFDVAERTAALLERSVSVLFVGSGDLEPTMRQRASNSKSVISRFHGFARQAELPTLYSDARVFLFPTRGDVWGIVVNEACAAGLPIITTPFAGAVGEIVKDGVNGYILNLDSDKWACRLQQLLTDEALYNRFSCNSLRLVAGHNSEAAAGGVLGAVFLALKDTAGDCSN